jgi:hypothetical protein
LNAPDSICQLVERFEEQRDAYHKGKYNETQLRSEFLNSFFEALGWNVLNLKGHAERYREVILEASVEAGVTGWQPVEGQNSWTWSGTIRQTTDFELDFVMAVK